MSGAAPHNQNYSRALSRALDWLWRHRWLIVIFVVALWVRLHWNLRVHPLGHYIVSDMRGYDVRAGQLLTAPLKAYEYHGFFPYGTHYMLWGLKWLFGRYNYEAVSVVYAFMGAGCVAISYVLAARVSKRRWVPPALGVILIGYYPMISLSGYMLSETPFSLFLLLATLSLVRLAQEGRTRFAWSAGIWVSLAMVIRPQVLLSVAVFGLVWLACRTVLRRVRVVHLVIMSVPVAVTLMYSTERLMHHTGRRGLISENGTFNLTFGRCHARKIMSVPDGDKYKSRIMFGPPPLIQLDHRAKRAPKSWVQLEPALGPELVFPGYISDKEILREFIGQCWDETGLSGQLKYSVTNVMLLSGYNTMWPDSGQKYWRKTAKGWGKAHLYLFTFPGLLGLLAATRRREAAGMGLVAMHIWALMLLAFIIFGGARFRCPYDPLIILLALEGYGLMFAGGRWLVRRARGRMVTAPAEET